MRRFSPRLPSPSMVVALLALFIAVGGTGYAALKLPKNSVGTKQLKKNAVTSAKVKNRSLRAKDFKAGQLRRDPTGPAGGDLAGSYPNPAIAPNAVDGANIAPSSLTGADVNESSLDLAGDFTNAGLPDLPGVSCGAGSPPIWSNDRTGSSYRAGYYRDRGGIVHLRGNIHHCGGSTPTPIFTLPAGYRPTSQTHQITDLDDSSSTVVVIAPNGVVSDEQALDDQFLWLDGVTFRCEPSGVNGCP